MKIKLKYLCSDRDRHGNLRFYVRVPGQRKIRLSGVPTTEEFFQAYRKAIGQRDAEADSKARAGSFRALVAKYIASTKYTKGLDASTQSWQRRALEDICTAYGHCMVETMRGKHVRAIRNEKIDAGLPAAGNHRLKAMRAMFKWALEEEECENNPTVGVQKYSYQTDGHHQWTDEQMAQYRAFYPLGTKQRVAIDLVSYTSCRREDVVRFGPQHRRNGRLVYRQAKNEHRNPTDLDIPVHPRLAQSLDTFSSEHLTYLVTEWGKPFSFKGFGNRFKEWCRAAGLPDCCTLHGVRKHTASTLAEEGATPHQIGSVTGHTSLKEIERYTAKARRKRLATEAIGKLK
jgi:site-specific recombinase XerD